MKITLWSILIQIDYHRIPMSLRKVFCTSEGLVCGGVGTCDDFGCTCPESDGGDFCTGSASDSQSIATRISSLNLWHLLVTITVSFMMACRVLLAAG